MVSWSTSMVSHTPHEGNLAGHQLARIGISCDQEVLWFEEPPYLYQDILFKDGL